MDSLTDNALEKQYQYLIQNRLKSIMSNVSSPQRFSAAEERFLDHINITEKMVVPSAIKASGDYESVEGATKPTPWDGGKVEMNVPDRILVVGENKYYGTTALPREIVFENTVMSPDPGVIRIQTPPSVISLTDHYFPTVDEEDDHTTIPSYSPIHSEKNITANSMTNGKAVVPTNQWSTVPSLCGAGEGMHKGLTPAEELSHLRTQMAKLNRRLLALELDNNQRQQKEKFVIALGLGYFCFKFLLWLNK